MNDTSIISDLLSYIEDNLTGDLSLDTLACEFNYSKFYLARIFSEHTGCTLYKYIQGRRLTDAAQKLVETGQPIVEIAYEAHYNSQQAFTLAFHQMYALSPQTYRKNGVFLPRQPKIDMRRLVSRRSAAPLCGASYRGRSITFRDASYRGHSIDCMGGKLAA